MTGGAGLKTRPGFTLVEILIDFGVITAIAAAVLAAYLAAYKSIDLARAKISAVSLANKKMELIRNMPYDDLGTVGGWPHGEISDKEMIEQNGTSFDVYTTVSYIDDKYDGVASPADYPGEGLTQDLSPYDYKEATIRVVKHGKNGQLAKLITKISAKAAETPSDTGILDLCIIDELGNPVPDADIRVENDDLTDPPFAPITTLKTGSNGCVLLPNLREEEQNHYHIIVSKDGYSTDMTFPRTPQNPNAIQPDANVIIQQVTSIILSIDYVSTMNLHFTDPDGNPIPNLSFNIEGSKKAYFNPETYKCSTSIAEFIPDSPCLLAYTTDSAGNVSIPNLEFDSYKIKNLSSGFLISTIPMQEINLPARTTLPVVAVVSGSSTNPAIYNFLPTTGIAGDTLTLEVTGSNIDNNATLKLINPNTGAEIGASNVEISPHTKIIADFNLAGAEAGIWDLMLTNPGGENVTQKSSFEIKAN